MTGRSLRPGGAIELLGEIAAFRREIAHGLQIGIAAADIALYRAKNTGRDRVCVYDPADKASGATGATGMTGIPGITGAPGIKGAPGMTGASGAPQLN